MSNVVEGIQPVSAYAKSKYNKFKINLWEFGNHYTCCYSYFLPWCAASQARTLLDSSPCLFNVCCITPVVDRWLIRTAYGIPGNWYYDCCFGVVCLPCSANQLLQTTQAYGPLPNAGKAFNQGSFDPRYVKGNCCSCCYALCCNQCAVATALERGTGMPCCMGLVCSNLFSARNILRYHYRIAGNDLWEECFIPYFMYSLAWAGSTMVPCLAFFIVPILVTMTSNLLNETSLRGSGHRMRYLAGYHLTDEELAMIQMSGNPRNVVEAEVSVPNSDPNANVPVVQAAPTSEVIDRNNDNSVRPANSDSLDELEVIPMVEIQARQV